jgi:hypothetical protein
MPIFDPRERSFPVLPSLILANILPLIGVLYYDVSFFALIYLYWWETVIISVFQFIKMGKAQKKTEPDPGFTINGKALSYEQVNSKRYMRFTYALIRIVMLAFYLLFIVIFVGVLSSSRENDFLGFARALMFIEPWVVASFLAFVFTHLVEYIVWMRDEDYKNTSLRELGSIFDARVIVIHVVIVLGTFAAMFAGEKLFPETQNAGSIAYTCLFVLLKVIVDVYAYARNTRRTALIGSFNALRKK